MCAVCRKSDRRLEICCLGMLLGRSASIKVVLCITHLQRSMYDALIRTDEYLGRPMRSGFIIAPSSYQRCGTAGSQR